MQTAEEYLRIAASRGQEIVLEMVRELSGALVYPDPGNVVTNEKLWDRYAEEWAPGADWVKSMSEHNEERQTLGDEWAPRAHTERVFDEWIAPLLGATTAAAEIGCGGGRIARLIAPRVMSLALFDVSAKMLDRARSELGDALTYIHVDGEAAGFGDGPRQFPLNCRHAFDFIVCFDVMVHMDVHTMFRTLKRIYAMLKPCGIAFVSTANLKAPAGWARFEQQRRASVGGFCFVTPETVVELIQRSGLRLLRSSKPDPSNTYYNRDFLALLEPAS